MTSHETPSTRPLALSSQGVSPGTGLDESGVAPPLEKPPIDHAVSAPTTLVGRIRRKLLGPPRDPRQKEVFHQISLVAFLAWVGLGADGLSSSAYGPEEAFKALEVAGQDHTYLAAFLALATALTVFIISYTYSRIIEQFPAGGGGYAVASQLLGPKAGVVSGSALLVDYMLTISISIAAGADALWSSLPAGWEVVEVPFFHRLVDLKLTFEVFVVLLLVVMNLRGVKETVGPLVPIFLVFVVTHALLILGTIVAHVPEMPALASSVTGGVKDGVATLGVGGLALLFARAYSLGGGTYTGIEAVSNGMSIMREPRVQTAKRTMIYMATSLAFTAAGLVLCYLLVGARPEAGKTMNAVFVEKVAGAFKLGSLPVGHWFVVVVLLSEMALLFVAAQASFIDGPRVMANMAQDSWLPRRFSSLSDRLTTANGVVLMGAAAILGLVWTHGKVETLVVMYSINVFVTFSLSNLAMCRFWLQQRVQDPKWKRHFPVHLTGLALCVTILGVTVYEKFAEGGWITLVATSAVFVVCLLVKRHYDGVSKKLLRLDAELAAHVVAAEEPRAPLPIVPEKPTAVVLVTGWSGLGLHTVANVWKSFPGFFGNVVFASVAVVDSGNFKGEKHVGRAQARTEEMLKRYVAFATEQGLPSTYIYAVGIEPVSGAEALCKEASKTFPKCTFFAGQLIFQDEKWYHRVLHNNTAYAIQKRLQWDGLPMVILPVRVRS